MSDTTVPLENGTHYLRPRPEDNPLMLPEARLLLRGLRERRYAAEVALRVVLHRMTRDWGEDERLCRLLGLDAMSDGEQDGEGGTR